MASLNQFKARRNEAWEKLLEILEHGLNHADYIEVEEANREIAKRYMWLAQMGWPQFFQKEVRECPLCGGGLRYVMTWEGRFLHYTCKECNAHLKLDILLTINHSAEYEVIKEVA